MPNFHLPRMSFHRAGSQATVRPGGKDLYLAPCSTTSAKVESDRVIAD